MKIYKKLKLESVELYERHEMLPWSFSLHFEQLWALLGTRNWAPAPSKRSSCLGGSPLALMVMAPH